MAKLKNAKHEAVLQHYLASADRVGWKSYRHVYPKSSQRAAEVGWSRLLKVAEFSARQKELERAVAERVVERTGVSIERIVAELAKLGFANLKEFSAFAFSGDLAELDDDVAAALKSVTVDHYTDGRGDDAREVKRVKFEIHDKRGPLIDLLKHLGALAGQEQNAAAGQAGQAPSEEKLGELEIARRILFTLEQAARAKAAAPKGK